MFCIWGVEFWGKELAEVVALLTSYLKGERCWLAILVLLLLPWKCENSEKEMCVAYSTDSTVSSACD